MTALVPIGEFSRLTHLTVKTLRYYHVVGLLVPDQIDAQTGYRRYTTAQVGDALLIGRLRALDLPLAEVREVVAEPERRDPIIAAHLQRMEAALDRTLGVVSSLRALLEAPARATEISYRSLDASYAVVHTERVSMAEIAGWCGLTYGRICGDLARRGVPIVGPVGALYDQAFFHHDAGEVTAFVPVDPPQPDSVTLPGGRFAVASHHGSYRDIDQTYAAIGSQVLERHQLTPGPVRELYLVGPDEVDDENDLRSQVWWPIAG